MATLEQTLQSLQHAFTTQLATITDLAVLEEFRITFLGRHGKIQTLVAQLKDLSPEEKRIFGPQINQFKEEAQRLFEQKKNTLEQQLLAQAQAKKINFDVTAYKPQEFFGTLHPYSLCIQRIEDVVTTMGFEIADGPEVEHEEYNFEVLNVPKDHPARDMQDTFWLNLPGMLLRTHTSSVQAHMMKSRKPPMAIIVPGRAYRHEATDASHDFMFLQCEGMLIDKNISMANLFAVTRAFLAAFFEKNDLSIRIRPGYFPFVEPGVEIDMTCPFCQEGCSTCKHTRWIEICGAGLIHPNVLRAGGIDPEEYSGFAFGFGLTRLAMLKYGINDIRLLHDGKIDFLKQF